MQFGDFGHAGFGEMVAWLDFLVFNVEETPLDNVADLLHVDGEADDVCPAAAFFPGQSQIVVADDGEPPMQGSCTRSALLQKNGGVATLVGRIGERNVQRR